MRRTRILPLAGIVALSALGFASGAAAQDPAHPAHIHAGRCPEPGDVVQPLADIVQPTDEEVGGGAATPVEVSTTTVELALADIVGGEHAVNVHESADAMQVYIACGDIAGTLLGTTDVAIQLSEQNDSGHHGTAWLHDNGDGTTRVDVVLVSEGVTGTPTESMAPTESAPASMAPVESAPASMAPASMAPASMAPASMAPGSEAPVGTAAPVESPAAS